MSYLGLRNGLSSLCVCEVSVRDWWSYGGFLCVLHNGKCPLICKGRFFFFFWQISIHDTDASSDK